MSDTLPSLEGLRCFSEAARLLNFRAAARVVGMTPAALGQRVRQLEELLDVRLFHRTTRAVTLTEAGQALLPLAQNALKVARECLAASRGQAASASVDVLLGTRHELGLSWIVPMLPRLRAAHPGLNVHVYFGSGADLVHRVRMLQLDCAVTSSLVTDARLESFRLHEETYVFVAAPTLLARLPLSDITQGAQHVLIDISSELPLFRYFRDAWQSAESLRFARTLSMGTIAAIRQLVVEGEGVAVLPAYFVAPDLEAGRLVRLFSDAIPQSDFFRLVFRQDDPRRAIYERMAETMRGEPLR